MSASFIIGIGGSGARSTEALLHLCASGLGPESLAVGFVDPDKANGNIGRSAKLRLAYEDARNAFYRSDGNSWPAGTCDLFRTVVSKIGSKHEDGVWKPVPESADTMREIFEYPTMKHEDKMLFDALFLATEEQKMPLNEGFRGRPSVGATVLGARARDDDPFWEELFQVTQRAKVENEISIFLIGSAFGGTGAAGFPIIARMLRDRMRKDKVEQNVKLAGALMLPYFSFPQRSASGGVVAAKATAFMAKAEQALAFYHRLLLDDPIFDNLYLVGMPKMIALNSHNTGGRDQCNPPMIPELYAALAAARFFNQGEDSRGTVFHIGRGEETKFHWDDLPAVRNENNRGEVKEKLGKAVRFSYAFSRVYAPILKAWELERYSSHYWFRRSIGETDFLLTDDGQRALDSIKSYCDDLLRFMHTISASTTGIPSGNEAYLINNIGYIGGSQESDNNLASDGLATLKETVKRDELHSFDDLIIGAKASSLGDVFDALTVGFDRQTNDPKAKNLGKFVSLLNSACELCGTAERS